MSALCVSARLFCLCSELRTIYLPIQRVITPIAKSWIKHKSILNDKLWYIHTIEYNSVIERNKLLSHEKTERDFTCLLLSKRNPAAKTTYCMSPTMWHRGKGKTMAMTVKGQGFPSVVGEGGLNGWSTGHFWGSETILDDSLMRSTWHCS